MSRLLIEEEPRMQREHAALAEGAATRLVSIPSGKCPVDFTASLARMYLADSCGKCTPCRVGLKACSEKLDRILDGNGSEADVEALKATAQVMFTASDCAIGFTAGKMLLDALAGFAEDFESHVQHDACSQEVKAEATCTSTCPAHVDVPAYIGCIRAGRLDDALRVIRNNNPLPTVCGYVCEHPCEMTCRRSLVDAPVNICGLKRFAADNAQWSPAPKVLPDTGKAIAVVGGGPAGLTAAYYLRLMGHAVTIYDQREKLGGMVRYGIPDYRLPQQRLDADIDFILSTGVSAHTGCTVGQDVSFDELAGGFDAVYVAIGAHAGKKLGCDGEEAEGVLSAVEFLGAAGSGCAPDLAGKRVCVVGGGNVAMDCVRTAKRLGASWVECVYRRRIADMTALAEEIEEAQAEGCQITQLAAPVGIQLNAAREVAGLIVQPQVIGAVGRGGRPAPYAADVSTRTISCDVIVVAVGQAIDSSAFAHVVKTDRGCIIAREDASVADAPVPLYAGGDAVSGPATVIKAIAAGKVAAANIDEALGFAHDVFDEVDIPPARPAIGACGRVNLKDVAFAEAACTFDLAKIGMSAQEAAQEASRCLRCDHYGFAATRTEEVSAW